MFIRKPLFYMSDDAGSTGDSGDSGSADGGANAGGDQGGKADDGKTFTQADVDRIIAGRLSKYGDYDAIKTELDQIKTANQSESEKALNAAKDEGRKEARIEAAEAVALEVFNGAAGRRNADYDTAGALELIDLRKFVKDDGTVDREAVTKAVERLVPEPASKTAPGFGGGPRKGADKPEATPGIGRLRAAYADPK